MDCQDVCEIIMKRVPPVIGCAVLEEEDVKQMPEQAKVKLAMVYGLVIGTSVGMVTTFAAMKLT